MSFLVSNMQKAKSNMRILPVLNASGKREEVLIRIDDSRNEYIKVDDLWIRNYTKQNVISKDLNSLYEEEELKTIIENEIKNSKVGSPNLLEENFQYENVLIISDGLGFDEHKKLLDNLNPNFCVIAVNSAMTFWESTRFPDFFLVNNPFESIFAQTLKSGWPKLIASRRTNNKFITNYRNIKYFYDPTCNQKYQSPVAKKSSNHIDDYRNPICAALGCAWNFGAKNIVLAYCSNAYKKERPGCEQVDTEAWCYPQQILANKIINSYLFWNKLANPNNNLYYTGIKNSFSFAKYLDQDVCIQITS